MTVFNRIRPLAAASVLALTAALPAAPVALAEEAAGRPELSPMRRIDALTAPLRVVHGAHDTNVPVPESRQIVAALEARGVSEGLLVSAAVDTPYLPQDFAAVMADELGDAPAALAAWGADFYPTNAIWRIEALADLPRRVMAGTAPGSLKALLADLGARRVDWRGRCAADPFRNVNTVADLLALSR